MKQLNLKILQNRLRNKFLKSGVKMLDPETIYFSRDTKIGKNVVIKPSVSVKYPWKLIIGDNVWIGENVWIDNLDQVTIGNNVCSSQGALLLCGNHNYKKTSFDLMVGPIELNDGVWIGAKSVVSQNVVCQSHSVLAVQSVCSSNLEAYSIYRGNPAVKVKNRIIE